MGVWESAEIAMEKPARALEQLKKAAVLTTSVSRYQ